MTPEEHDRVRELFAEACDLDPAERPRFLEAACGGSDAVRGEVESLLESEDELRALEVAKRKTEESIEGTATGETSSVAAHAGGPEDVGDRIGRFRILGKLGEGGMGVVYLAEQREPVRRRVALKVIKLGMDTKEVVARFEAERQALAMLDHQNIAKVYDGGATEDGRPYFVMEHVQGVPIIEYCDRHKLTISERLQVFLQVCQGIEHAHHRGIIHRDIKPTNILAGMPDKEPVAKIIDFGVARATNQRLTEKTIYTEIGRAVGTFFYMSPEQAEFTSEGLDHRTDIYSLGAVLYELLVGQVPLELEVRETTWNEIVRRIQEEEDGSRWV